MGQRGPAPKPTELKLLEGNRGHRPLNLDQLFRPEVGTPDIPKWLTPGARKAWRRLSVELTRYNVLSRIDRDNFAMLCQTIGRMELIEQSFSARQALLLDQGKDPSEAFMDSTPNGLRIQSALYQILNKEQEKARVLLASFGLAPDARAKVTTAIRTQLQLFEVPKDDQPARPAEPMGFAEFD